MSLQRIIAAASLTVRLIVASTSNFHWALAACDRQVGNLIPPGSTLVFEVELADLKGLDREAPATP
jgi:hypothetical protein